MSKMTIMRTSWVESRPRIKWKTRENLREDTHIREMMAEIRAETPET